MESQKAKGYEDISLWITWGEKTVFSRISARKTLRYFINRVFFDMLHKVRKQS